MFSPRWRKVLRDLWLHKARTSLVVLAVCIGIIGAGSVLDAWSLLGRVTRGEFGESNPASATLRTDSIDAALLARVRAIPAIASAQARRTVTASVQTSVGASTALLFAMDDFTSNVIGIIKPESGTWPPRDGSVIVEPSSVEFAEVGIGDSVVIQLRDGGTRALPVAGIARDVGLAPGWMEHVVYLFVTRATLAQLGAPATLNELQFVVRDRSLDREGVRSVAREIAAMMESSGHRVASVDVPVPGRHIHAAQIDSLLYTQGAFGMLALFLSGILVVNLIAAMLTGQVREIGVMKSIGARASQLATMYLGLALILGIVASVVAIPIAAVLGRAYADFTATILNFDVSGFSIPFWAFGLQLAVGTLLPVVAAAIPVSRGCRISVSEAMRDFGISARGETATGRLLLRSSGVSRPLLLSLRNAFRRRQRMLLTLATLATGGAVYLGALNLRAAVIGSVDLLFASQRYDMVFRLVRPHAADSIVARVATLPGVARAEAWTGARASVSRPDGLLGASFPISAVPVGSTLLAATMERGRWFSGRGNELVVNRRAVDDDPQLDVGKTVTLIVGGKLSQWTIVGVTDTGPSPAAFASRETIASLVTDGGANIVVIAATDDARASMLDLIRRVRGELGEAGFEVSTGQLMSAQREVVEDHLVMVAGFLGNMSLLMIVVGGLGLASTMSLAVLERTREIGVLRAIGARHGSILAMVQIEGLVIAVLSWALALPLSIPMSVALEVAFGRIMLKTPIKLVPEFGGVVQWFAVVVLVSLISCAWPALRATRIPTAKALAFE
ncbi:MAG: FtsX-like permease family protein [Gemmatimonadetes bacterium]|nr:FtsX-like permease family protein [Gemmatimonadota bacterium]